MQTCTNHLASGKGCANHAKPMGDEYIDWNPRPDSVQETEDSLADRNGANRNAAEAHIMKDNYQSSGPSGPNAVPRPKTWKPELKAAVEDEIPECYVAKRRERPKYEKPTIWPAGMPLKEIMDQLS